MGAHPHTPGAHQLAGADWIEVPELQVRKHLLAGAFYLSKEAETLLAHVGLPLDTVLCWFNKPHAPVEVGDTLLMGNGLEAFFGFDESQPGARAFFVEIDLKTSPTRH